MKTRYPILLVHGFAMKESRLQETQLKRSFLFRRRTVSFLSVFPTEAFLLQVKQMWVTARFRRSFPLQSLLI